MAEALHLPLLKGEQSQGFSYGLVLTSERIELRTFAVRAQGPISSSLWDGDIRRRVKGGRLQPLARACGLHRDGAQRVLDATAGLGRDGMVLAGLGCSVTMLERSPVVAVLLSDGLSRAADGPACDWVASRTQLIVQDACHYMATVQECPQEVVYLDPMYPQGNKSALAKKEMRVLRVLAGEDADAGRLLQSALGFATRRVVVKRPVRSEYLDNMVPDHQIRGNRARYDVYYTRKYRKSD